MSHDFGNGGTNDIRYDSQGNRCTGINGVMDYGARNALDKWTTCSKEDFTAFYNRMIQTYGSFCLTCGECCYLFLVKNYPFHLCHIFVVILVVTS